MAQSFEDPYMGLGGLQVVRHKLELLGHSAKLGKRTRVQFSHRPAAVDLHRRFSDAHIAGNLSAKATSRDLYDDLALSRAERPEAFPEGGQSRFAPPTGTVPRQAEVNGVE